MAVVENSENKAFVEKYQKEVDRIYREYKRAYDEFQRMETISLPIESLATWMEWFLANPKIDGFRGKYFTRHVDITNIIHLDVLMRFQMGRTVDIDIFGPKGRGKSLLAIHFLLTYDDDLNYINSEDLLRQRIKYLFPLQISGNMNKIMRNISSYSKYMDVYESIMNLSKNLSKNDIWKKYVGWLDKSPYHHYETGGGKIYYDGYDRDSLRDEVFESALEYLLTLGYISKKGRYYYSSHREIPNKIFVVDEEQNPHGEGSIISQDSFGNMIKVARIRRISLIFAGVEQYTRYPFDYVITMDEGGSDKYNWKRLILLKAGVFYPFHFGGAGSEASGYGRIGTLYIFSPPDWIIQEYLGIERIPTGSASLGGLGMIDFERMEVMKRYRKVQMASDYVDVEVVVDDLVDDDDFKRVIDEKGVVWNRIRPIAKRILDKKYDKLLTSSLWDEIRLELEKRGYSK